MPARLLAALLVAYAAVAAVTGPYLNERDSEPRLLAAERAAAGDASVLLDPWQKPVLTTLAALVVRLGGGVVALKVLQGALAAAALALAAATARRQGASAGATVLAAVLAALGPFWVRGVVSLLTETSCAFLLALAVWLWARNRPVLSALAVSVSFLARFDGLLFAVAWTPFLLRRRCLGGVLALAAAPLAWHLAGWAVTGEAAFLLARQPHPWREAAYGSGSFLRIAALLPVTAGVVLLPALLGLRRTHGPALAAAAAALLGHSAMWGLGIMGSYGMPRYLVTIVPVLAVAASFGLERLRRTVRVALVVLAVAGAGLTVAYREIGWRGAVRLADVPRALTEDPLLGRLNGGGARLATWRTAPPGAAVAWESVWTEPDAFASIPPDRLVLERTVALPARWPWEVPWEGRIYRLR